MANIRCRGENKFQVRIVRRGFKPIAKTFHTLHTAEAWAERTERQLLDGGVVPTPARLRLTLLEALQRYEVEITPKKRGAEAERGRIRLWKRHELAHRYLDSILGKDLAKSRDARLTDGKSPNTVRLELALISHLFEIARREWGFESLTNPTKAIRKPQLPSGRERRLHPNEESILVSHCNVRGNFRLKAAIVLALETGMRRSELATLRWDNLDLLLRTAHLPLTKNGSTRTVPLSKAAVAIIRSSPPTITGSVLGVRPHWITEAFIDACKECNLVGLRFHDLRHEATSRLFEKGFNMMEVAAITGHKTLQMLKRYTHLRVETLVERLG